MKSKRDTVERKDAARVLSITAQGGGTDTISKGDRMLHLECDETRRPIASGVVSTSNYETPARQDEYRK